MDSSLIKAFNNARESLDIANELHRIDAEKDLFRQWDDINNPINGRLSPFAKEEIYRAYLRGATVKDLSLKFGILP